MATMDAFKIIEAPSGSSGSAFCTVKRTLHIDVEDRVIKLLSNRSKRRIPRNTGIREENIELALLRLDLGEEVIKIGKVRHVSLYARDIFFRSPLRPEPTPDHGGP
jgi:hypothetical protein